MEQTPTEPETQTGRDDLLTDIEIRREKQDLERITSKLDGLFGQMHGRYRVAMRLLMATGAFTEHDIQLMLRGQILSPEFSGLPCEEEGRKDELMNVEIVEARRHSQRAYDDPLSPVPRARHRLHCPLYERGQQGDPLVPCYEAQRQNPNAPKGEMKEAPFLPPDLPPDQREAINFFVDPMSEDLRPCKVLQALCQYEMSTHIKTNAAILYQIRQKPVPPSPQPPPERKGDLTLRRHLQMRQSLLEEQERLFADEERQRRELLRHLFHAGRLTTSDLVEMTYKVQMVTDQGWLPCRDDPQRTYIDPVDHDDDPDPSCEDARPQRYICALKLRAMEGDTTVPCCEAQKVAPSPERIAELTALKEKQQADYAEFWRRRGGEPERFKKAREPVVYWAGPDDAPGGPLDIVRLLSIRPCYLLGHTAASYLYDYGQYLCEHPEDEDRSSSSDPTDEDDTE